MRQYYEPSNASNQMNFGFKKLFKIIKKPFQQGLNWKEVIKAIIVSLLIAVIPIFGVTTLLLTFISIKFKLNLPIMIVISYLASPLQFILFLPFIHLGETIMHTEHTLLTVQEIKAAFDISFFDTIKSLLFELICGISGWLLLALPVGLVMLFFNKMITIPEKAS